MANGIKGLWKVQKHTNNMFTIFYGLYNFISKSQ